MEGIKFENINKKEGAEETIEKEKHSESVENVKAFIDEEKELLKKGFENSEKEFRIKTIFKKVVIGATIMASLWSVGKMENSKAEASESNIKQEERIDVFKLNRQASKAVDALNEPVVIERKANDEDSEKTTEQVEKQDGQEVSETEELGEIFENLKTDIKELTKESESLENILKYARILLNTEEEKFMLGDKEYTREGIAKIISDSEIKKRETGEKLEISRKIAGHAYLLLSIGEK